MSEAFDIAFGLKIFKNFSDQIDPTPG